jgi:hypothetical protein
MHEGNNTHLIATIISLFSLQFISFISISSTSRNQIVPTEMELNKAKITPSKQGWKIKHT